MPWRGIKKGFGWVDFVTRKKHKPTKSTPRWMFNELDWVSMSSAPWLLCCWLDLNNWRTNWKSASCCLCWSWCWCVCFDVWWWSWRWWLFLPHQLASRRWSKKFAELFHACGRWLGGLLYKTESANPVGESLFVNFDLIKCCCAVVGYVPWKIINRQRWTITLQRRFTRRQVHWTWAKADMWTSTA